MSLTRQMLRNNHNVSHAACQCSWIIFLRAIPHARITPMDSTAAEIKEADCVNLFIFVNDKTNKADLLF